MGFHHTAFATKDAQATHAFYTQAMGFELVKTIITPTENGGWAKHLFYEISPDEFIAFWDIHDDTLPKTWSPAISTGQGLPIWINHLAFRATDLADLDRRRQRLVDHGHTVTEIDHGWCTSIYCVDPNGILVEFCTTTQTLTAKDREEALRLLNAPNPPIDKVPPKITRHDPKPAVVKRAGVAS